MSTFRTILTNVGAALAAAAAANGSQIVLTEMAVGDGNGNPVTPNPASLYLARERFRSTLNRLQPRPSNPLQFEAEIVIPASEGGFVVREVGLFTSDGALFAVANVPDTYKPTSDEGAYSDTVIKMVFEVANASVVTLVIDPAVTLATRSWVQNNVTRAALIPGGLTNQVLAKKSNADGDTEWRDPTAAIEVVVWSLEESQTLAAGQLQVDLVTRTTDGAAVYINGTRLREDQWTPHPSIKTRLTLGQAYAGAKFTLVQNEEVGKTELLFRAQNLADVLDPAAARANLGIPGAISSGIASATIQWAQLAGLPAFATRWPTWAEVANKPASFPPDAHTHAWPQISGAPDTATRWPTWGEVTGKPALFTPAAHTHVWGDISNPPATAVRWPSWGEVTDRPAAFPPAAHGHAIADVAGLQGALDGKAPSGHTHTAAQITDLTAFVNGLIAAALVNYLPKDNPTFTGTMTGPAYNKAP